jgi:hypothetical protein
MAKKKRVKKERPALKPGPTSCYRSGRGQCSLCDAWGPSHSPLRIAGTFCATCCPACNASQ